MLAVSAVSIELAGAKLKADRLKNVFKESCNFRSGVLPAGWRSLVGISKIEIFCKLSASRLCVFKSG